MSWKFLALGISLCGAVGSVSAETTPLYQQRVEQAVPDAEALKHSAELLQAHKEVPIQSKPVIQPFHKQEGELETAPNAFCRNCHGSLPHDKSLRTRAFLNMHVRFIACESCHFRPKEMALEYRWFDYQDQSIVSGQGRFRLSHEIDNAKQRPSNPKIAPFYHGEPAFVVKDSAFSLGLAEQWKQASPDDRVVLRARIHWPLEKKGPECHDCHTTDKPVLELTALGATPDETQAMHKHVIPQFFRHYEKDDQRITIRNLLR